MASRYKKLPRSVYRAINMEATPAFGKWAKQEYGVGGKRLLALVAAGEGGGTSKHPNISSAGARGPYQFIPETRQSYMRQYGIDPWKNDRLAVRGAIKHLMGTGVAGYNPGMPSYTNYILGQQVDTQPLKTGRYGVPGTPQVHFNRRGPGGTKDNRKFEVLQTLGQLDAAAGSKDPLASSNIQLLKSLTPQKLQTPGKVIGNTVQQRAQPGQLKPGGGWGGAKHPATVLAQIGFEEGLKSVSEKRPTRNTSSGGVSDHYEGNETAYAYDLSNGDSPTPEMDRAARRIAAQLGIKNWKFGVLNVTRGGYRYQVLYRTNVGGNHYNHVHVGVRKV